MTKKSVETINKNFVLDIRGIIEQSRRNAVRSVDFCRVQMYWNIGRRIQVEEQKGKKRADYGSFLLKNLSKELEPEYGSGFSVRQLEMCRRFYTLYPIANAVRSQLNWTQYRDLIKIDDPEKREYYELETINNAWTSRELERQIHSQLYERLLMSSDKERNLETVLPLSQGKEEFSLKMTLPENNETILASEFKLYMPSKEQLIAEVKQIREDFEKIHAERS